MKQLLPVFAMLFFSCGTTEGPPVSDNPLHGQATPTAFTTRLPARDAETQAIVIAQTVYPATREENAAGAIILSPQNEALAFTAMHRITHMPVNAPLLYLDQNLMLSEATKNEMKRLKPDGVMQDGKVQVYLVGKVHSSVLHTLEHDLEYKVRKFNTDDPVQLSEVLDRWQAAMKSDHPDEVVISALDHPRGIAYGIGAMGWNAHMGRGFAWVYRDSVPKETREILERRFGNAGAYMYLTGSRDVISDKVAVELQQYGMVRRIKGKDRYETNAVNAGYKDFGRNFGWWWSWEPRAFGWGISQAGHNFIIAADNDLLKAIPSVLLGHMGKHGPLLLVYRDSIPKSVSDYLTMVRPYRTGPQETILNHGWIIGDERTLSRSLQMQIDSLLSPLPAQQRGKMAYSSQ